MGIKINRHTLLFLAFFFIQLGDAQFVMKSNMDKPIIYFGLFLLVLGSFITWMKIPESCIRKRMLFWLVVTTGLLSYGIIKQNMDNSKKISLVLSVFLLALIAVMSRNLIQDYKGILMCSLGVFTAIAITFAVSLFISDIYMRMGYDNAFTFGTEHKNYVAASFVAVIMGCAIYCRNVKKTNILYVIQIISLIGVILSSSVGGLLILVLFVAIFMLGWFRELTQETRWIFEAITALAMVAVAIIFYATVAVDSNTFASRIDGLIGYIEKNKNDDFHMIYGYAENAYMAEDYVEAARALSGWRGTPEMAVMGVLIKSGILGCIAHVLIILIYMINIRRIKRFNDRLILLAVLLPFILSIFVETYMVNLNLVFGPFCYVVLMGIINIGYRAKEEGILANGIDNIS